MPRLSEVTPKAGVGALVGVPNRVRMEGFCRDLATAWILYDHAGYLVAKSLEPRSREELVTFLRDLHEEFRSRGHEWENNTLDGFLEALAAWVHDSPGVYYNGGEQIPRAGDWTFMARALHAATIYE